MGFGLIDVGRLVDTDSTLSQAVREGARLAAAEAGCIGSTHPACVSDASGITTARPGAHDCSDDVAAVRSHVSDARERMTVAVGPLTTLHLSCNDGIVADPAPSGARTEASDGNGFQNALGNAISAPGDLVSVRVDYTYDTFAPFVTSSLGSIPRSASATMVID